MTFYIALKTLHIGTALISVVLFAARWSLSLAGRQGWRATPLRWVPHANDSVLLSAAIGLCVVTGWLPLVHHWLTAKVLLLIGYILAGKLALAVSAGFRQKLCMGMLAGLQVGGIFLLAMFKPSL
ncbi:MAG: SirB2 family protein [Alcanivoracaceae bacterium]|nr:SirB2 family protein [Alcanivoracaceae bacterium]